MNGIKFGFFFTQVQSAPQTNFYAFLYKKKDRVNSFELNCLAIRYTSQIGMKGRNLTAVHKRGHDFSRRCSNLPSLRIFCPRTRDG